MQTSASIVLLGISGQITLCRKCLLTVYCSNTVTCKLGQMVTPLEEKKKYRVKLILHATSGSLAK